MRKESIKRHKGLHEREVKAKTLLHKIVDKRLITFTTPLVHWQTKNEREIKIFILQYILPLNPSFQPNNKKNGYMGPLMRSSFHLVIQFFKQTLNLKLIPAQKDSQ